MCDVSSQIVKSVVNRHLHFANCRPRPPSVHSSQQAVVSSYCCSLRIVLTRFMSMIVLLCVVCHFQAMEDISVVESDSVLDFEKRENVLNRGSVMLIE